MADLTITINPPNTNTITISDGVLPHNSTHAPSGNDSLESWYAKVSDLEYVSGQIGTPAGVVLTTGNQEIGGVKNFSSRPTVNGSGVMLTGETPGTGYLTGYVGRSETGSFVSTANTGNFVTSSQTGQFTGVFYPYSANPAAYIQGAVVRPSNTGNFIDKASIQTISAKKYFSDIPSFTNQLVVSGISDGNNSSSNNISFIDPLYNFVGLSISAGNSDGNGFLIANNLLTLNGSGGVSISGGTVSFLGQRPTFNGTGFLLSGEASAATTGYLTGYVNKTETGTFYSTSNPSGYITGVDLSTYATTSFVTGISGYQSGLIASLQSVTGTFALAANTGAFLTTGAADTRYINATGDVVNGNLEVSGYTSGQSFVLKNGGYLDFQTGTPAWKEGRVFYDNDSKTLSYYNDEPDVTLNIGQENIVRISNGETGNIPNGKVVYISGSQGNRPKGYLASASSGVTSWERTIGVSTHDISTQGYVTTFGVVNGLNTTGFVEGDHLYLSETNPGEFSTAIPSSPNHKVQVGTVLRSHATQGSILVTVNQGNHLWNLHDVKQSAWTNNQILRYNQPSGYWEAQDLNTGAFLTTGAADSRYLTSASGFNSRMSSVFTTGVISGVGGTVFSVYQSASALPMISGFAGLSGSITPINAASKIRVKLAAQVSAATNIFFGIALARSGDANAKVQTCVQTARSDITYPIFLEYEEVAGTTGRIDYITRWGPQSNNAFFTGYWNRAAAGNSFGLGSSMEIIEILP